MFFTLNLVCGRAYHTLIMQVDMLGVFHNCPLFGHFQVAMRDLHCDSLQADCPLGILPERSQLW